MVKEEEEEEAQALPARERVADGLGKLRLPADQAEFFPQPWPHGLEDRLAPLPPLDPTGIGTVAADCGFDAAERMRWRASLAIGAGAAWASSHKRRRTWDQHRARRTPPTDPLSLR